MAVRYINQLVAAGLTEAADDPTLQEFAAAHPAPQNKSSASQTRRRLRDLGFSDEAAEILIPRSGSAAGRPPRSGPLSDSFPGLSLRAAEAASYAIGLDRPEDLLDAAVWDSEAVEAAVAAVCAIYRTTAAAQRAEKALRAGVSKVFATGERTALRKALDALTEEERAELGIAPPVVAR